MLPTDLEPSHRPSAGESEWKQGEAPTRNAIRVQEEERKGTAPRRIALLFHLAPRKLGSMEDFLVGLCREGRERGHSVDVFCRAPWLPSIASELGRLGVGLAELNSLEVAPWKGIRRLRSYDVIQLNFLGLRDRASLMAYAAAPAKVVFVDHWSGRPTPDHSLKRLVRHGLDRLTALRIQRIAAVSGYVQTRDVQRLGVSSEVCRTVYNGVDTSRFAPLPQYGAVEAGCPLRILAVAHLIPHKGIDVLIKAMGRLGEVACELDIVGDGPEAERLKQLAAASPAGDRIRFLGLRSDVPDLLQRANVFVHPAVWAEAFGLTIAEAMATGTPVVATRTGAIPELIEDGRDGILVSPGDERALEVALRRLATDSGFARQLGLAARERALRHFGLGRCVSEHLALCEEASPRSQRASIPSQSAAV